MQSLILGTRSLRSLLRRHLPLTQQHVCAVTWSRGRTAALGGTELVEEQYQVCDSDALGIIRLREWLVQGTAGMSKVIWPITQSA